MKKKGSQEITISTIKSFLPLEMNRSELTWLRSQLESQDHAVRLAAEEVHGRKSLLASSYLNIKDSPIKQLAFFVQGELKNIHTQANEYRHVRYEANADGKLQRVLGEGDVNNPDRSEQKSSKKTSEEDAREYLRLFRNKLDELFATIPHFPEPTFSKKRYDSEEDAWLELNQSPIDFDHYKRAIENKIPLWSMRLTFENGASHTTIHEYEYIPEVDLLLDAMEEFFDTSRLNALEPDADWLDSEPE
jgi:hypothetical protein